MQSNNSQTCITLPSTPAQYSLPHLTHHPPSTHCLSHPPHQPTHTLIFGNMPQSSPFQSQAKTTTNWHKLPILSLITKTLEKTLLSYIRENSLIISHGHEFKYKQSTHIALHNIFHQIMEGLKNPKPMFCCSNIRHEQNIEYTQTHTKQIFQTTFCNVGSLGRKF